MSKTEHKLHIECYCERCVENKKSPRIEHMNDGERAALRRAVADYMAMMQPNCFCSDCREAMADAETRLASMLDVPQGKDGSYNWEQFRTQR